MQAAAAAHSFEESALAQPGGNPFMHDFNFKKRVKMRNIEDLEGPPAKRSQT